VAALTQVFELPYPPSVNHYWRRVGFRTLISRGGRRYRRDVVALLAAGRAAPLHGRLELVVHVFPPDDRRRDLDNLQKALCDALQHAGVYADDSQIDRLDVHRGPVVPGGKVVVQITERTCGRSTDSPRCSKPS
jgi:crossover junction endodeoxyribonuclease RusA